MPALVFSQLFFSFCVLIWVISTGLSLSLLILSLSVLNLLIYPSKIIFVSVPFIYSISIRYFSYSFHLSVEIFYLFMHIVYFFH